MTSFSTEKLSGLRKSCVFIGVGLLALSIVLLISVLIGLFELESLAALGHSGMRSLAGIAVAGCVLAAIGYYDE